VSPTFRASGTFDVKLTPLENDWPDEGTTLGRMAIEKTFRGDLEGTSAGEMLSARTPVQGSGAYCAMERVSGTLHGRTGTFVLQHTGVMDRARPSLVVRIVPDSGTAELAGLSGTMTITITEGRHAYDLDYSLPA
jgi:hypothetical protein